MNYTELEKSGDIRDKTFGSLIKAEAGQREDYFNKLKEEITKKETRMKEVLCIYIFHFYIIN